MQIRMYGGIYGGVWQSLCLVAVWSQVVSFVCPWQESGSSCHEDVFIFNLVYKEILYILYFKFDL
jgi:hypothetical protein